MPEATRIILPQKKPDNLGLKLAGTLFGLTIASGIGMAIWHSWVFNHMTTAQHLWEAKKLTPDLVDVDVALRHLSAIPSNAPEAREAQLVRAALRQKRSEMEVAQAKEQTARTQKQAETKATNDARTEAVSELGVELKNLGYELSVNIDADDPQQIVITSSDFGDTDHRVRFLSFMRSRNSPTPRICGNGFSKIRLRASQIPFVGFDDSYSLNCFGW